MFSLKVALNQDLRRVALDSTDVDFKTIESKIRSLFSLPQAQPFTVRYVDEDGDMITIDTTEELQEAVALALSSDKTTLKLTISLVDKPLSADNNTSTADHSGSSKQQEKPAAPAADEAPAHPLLGLAAAFAPQIAAVIAQLKQEPKFREAAVNFGLNLDEPDPVKLVEQVLNSPLLRDLCPQFPAAAGSGSNCNEEGPLSALFGGLNQSGGAHPLAALFAHLQQTHAGPSSAQQLPPFAAMFGPFAECFGQQQQQQQQQQQKADGAVNDDNDASEKPVHAAICDACQAKIVGIRWKCVSGCPDYDLCEACEPNKAEVHTAGHVFAKIERPLEQRRGGGCKRFMSGHCAAGGNDNNNNEQRSACHNAFRERMAKMHAYHQAQAERMAAAEESAEQQQERRVELVGHETVALGAVVATNQPFVKIWRVKNVGSTEWPAGTRAQYLSGDRLGDFRALVGDGSAVPPGAEARVAIDCRAPAQASASAKCVYRLVDRNGAGIGGDHLPIQVVVIE